MSEWTDLEPARSIRSAIEFAPVRVGIRRFKDLYKGNVLIRHDVADALEIDGNPVRILVGSGGRAHQLAIVPDEDGNFGFSEVGRPHLDGGLGRTWSSFFPLPASWPCIQMSAIAVTFEIENDRLILNLPAAFWDKGSRQSLLASFTPSPRPSTLKPSAGAAPRM